jgi:hypothetical protein
MPTTKCPYCARPVGQSENLILGRLTQFCRPCGVFRLMGDTDWQSVSPAALQAVRDAIAKMDKETTEQRDKAHQRQEEDRQRGTREFLNHVEWMDQQ